MVIKFEYADQTSFDSEREKKILNAINGWLGPFKEEFESEPGVLNVFFNKQINHLSIESLNKEFKEKLYERFSLFSDQNIF